MGALQEFSVGSVVWFWEEHCSWFDLFCKIFINLSPVPKVANFLRLRGVSSGQLCFWPVAGCPAWSIFEVEADNCWLPVLTAWPEVTQLASSTAADLTLSVSAAAALPLMIPPQAPMGSETPDLVGDPQADSFGELWWSFKGWFGGPAPWLPMLWLAKNEAFFGDNDRGEAER